LVFAVALAAVRAEDVKLVKPVEDIKLVKPVLTYAQPLHYPVAHQYYTPIVYNTHKVVTPVVQKVATPVVQKVITPVAAPVKEVTYEYQPEVTKYVAKPYDVEVKVQEPELVKTNCKNFLGFEVPCKQKREAEHHVPTVYTIPQVHYPVTYHQPTVVKYKALPTKVHEIEVPTPQFKKVVEKIPVQPLCTNNYGMPVPCIDTA